MSIIDLSPFGIMLVRVRKRGAGHMLFKFAARRAAAPSAAWVAALLKACQRTNLAITLQMERAAAPLALD